MEDTHEEWLTSLKMAAVLSGANSYDEINLVCERMFEVVRDLLAKAGEDPLTLMSDLLRRLFTVEEAMAGGAAEIMPLLALAIGTERAARREGLPSHLPVKEE